MKRISAIFLQIVIALMGVGALALLLWEPQTEGRNVHATQSQIYFHDPFLMLVYAGSTPFFIALYQVFTLLGYVRQDAAFSEASVKVLRNIKNCALIIIAFVVVEEIIIMLTHGSDDPAGGVFVGVLITLGSMIVAATAAMFEEVLQGHLVRK